MSRKAGRYALAGVLATIVYYGALVAVSPTFIDLGPAGGVPGALGPPQAADQPDRSATASTSRELSRTWRDPNAAHASAGRELPAALPNSSAPVAPTRSPAVTSSARGESSTFVPPVEERVGPDGGTYLLRNYGAAETEANERASSAARDAVLHEARRDPAAFATRHGLELEDLQAMLAGGRPFPEYLVAGAK